MPDLIATAAFGLEAVVGRELERLCGRDDGYRWICGGVSVNYHSLNDFRVEHGDKLDQVMVQILAAMTRDHREAVLSFLEKRPAVYRNH